ncbi:ABC transporter substrate-binding protein [uncultured Intestinimonas sp.]|uniref:ABC transporter substrate-binding protein n=1 Tax=uncultured Intestinimonas sp. TaxID=1689265 RepID=UPI0025E3DB85|nr:ABC transporter substrate-binding protein [uncultured Intestinimonas sp.]
MKPAKRITALCLVSSLILSIGLFGCSAKEETPVPSASGTGNTADGTTGVAYLDDYGIRPLAEPSTLTIGYFSGALYSAIIYGADQMGWFDAAGLDLDYVSFDSGPAMMEANSSWDVGISGAPGVLNGLIGYNVKCIGVVDYELAQGLYVRPDSPIALSGPGNIDDAPDIYGTADDWRGTTWIVPVGTSNYMVFLDTLDKLGLTLDDVTVINMDVSSAKSAFVSGQGDGVGSWNTIALSLEDEGYVRAASAETAGSIIASGMVATDAALAERRDQVVKFYEVFLAAQDYFSEHVDEYATYMNETCLEEGVSSTPEVAAEFVQTYKFLSGETIAKNCVTMIDDVNGTAGRQVSQTEADLLVMLDFFIDQGSYTEENRTYILENGCVDSSIAELAIEDLGWNEA